MQKLSAKQALYLISAPASLFALPEGILLHVTTGSSAMGQKGSLVRHGHGEQEGQFRVNFHWVLFLFLILQF